MSAASALRLLPLLPCLALLPGAAPAPALTISGSATLSIQPVGVALELVPPEPLHIDGGAALSAVDVAGVELLSPHLGASAGPALFNPLGSATADPLLQAFRSGVASHSWHTLRRLATRQPGRSPGADPSFGASLEWRWDRIRFDLLDSSREGELPYLETLLPFDRNVPRTTGRPRVAAANRFRHPDTDGDGLPDREAVVGFVGLGGQYVSWDPSTSEPVDADQQFFAVICSATVGIAAQLDPTACAFNLFPTPSPILQSGGFRSFPVTEVLSAAFAGEPDLFLFRFLNLAISTANGASLNELQGAIPYRALNRDSRLVLDPSLLPPELDRGAGRYGDGVNTHTNLASFNRTPFCLQGIPGPSRGRTARA